MNEVKSTAIASVGADGSDLLVKYNTGRTYRYTGAGTELNDLVASESVGRFVNSRIIGRFPASVES